MRTDYYIDCSDSPEHGRLLYEALNLCTKKNDELGQIVRFCGLDSNLYRCDGYVDAVDFEDDEMCLVFKTFMFDEPDALVLLMSVIAPELIDNIIYTHDAVDKVFSNDPDRIDTFILNSYKERKEEVDRIVNSAGKYISFNRLQNAALDIGEMLGKDIPDDIMNDPDRLMNYMQDEFELSVIKVDCVPLKCSFDLADVRIPENAPVNEFMQNYLYQGVVR